MNKKLYATCLIVSSLIFAGSVFGAEVKQDKEVRLKKGMEFALAQWGSWGNDKPSGAIGWLTVPGEGKVLVMLVGKSYYDKNINNDWTLRYIAHNTNGCQFVLPKGLFYWQTADNLGEVRPALRNRFHGQTFDLWLGEDNPKRLWHTGTMKKRTFWDPSKEKYPHPSQAINDLLSK